MTVGQKIKQLRIGKGLTQEELGDLLGVKKAAIQKYESGQVQNLKSETIKKLCKIFDKYPSHFIFDDFDTNLEKQLRKEAETIEFIRKQYGQEVFHILEIVLELDGEHLKKVCSYCEDISIIQSVKKNNHL